MDNRMDKKEEFASAESLETAEQKDVSQSGQLESPIGEATVSTFDFVEAEQKQFKSRFKKWIRQVALIVTIVFVPEQVSWAFNYDPSVLWRDKFAAQNAAALNNPQASPEEISSAQIAASVENLLKQVAYKEKSRIQLKLSPAASLGSSADQSLLLDSNVFFTNSLIKEVYDWLRNPGIHPLNCGVHALKDILASREIDVSLEELSVLTLMIDLMSNIVKPGEEKLKTSLYSIHRIVEAYGLDLKPMKSKPENLFKLQTPFIANFGSEHFVTVTGFDANNVYFSDIGQPMSLSRAEFIERSNGYVLAQEPSSSVDMSAAFEPVSDAMLAFIWGNAWHSRHHQLPGLISGKSLAISTAIDIGLMVGGAEFGSMLGAGNFSNLMVFAMTFENGVSTMMEGITSWCVLAGKCSPKTAFILNMGISMGASFGVSSIGSVKSALGAGVKSSISMMRLMGKLYGVFRYMGKYLAKGVMAVFQGVRWAMKHLAGAIWGVMGGIYAQLKNFFQWILKGGTWGANDIAFGSGGLSKIFRDLKNFFVRIIKGDKPGTAGVKSSVTPNLESATESFGGVGLSNAGDINLDLVDDGFSSVYSGLESSTESFGGVGLSNAGDINLDLVDDGFSSVYSGLEGSTESFGGLVSVTQIISNWT